MFTVGQDVTVRGRLFSGTGVVEAIATDPASVGALPTKYANMIRWSEPFPIVWVRTSDGRLIRYDGNDTEDGVIVPLFSPSAQQFVPVSTTTTDSTAQAPATETFTKGLSNGLTVTVTISLA